MEMTPHDPPEAGAPAEGDDVHPRGTLVLMVLFLIVLAVMWSYVYSLMLIGGPTVTTGVTP
jgi:hypothetical protein